MKLELMQRVFWSALLVGGLAACGTDSDDTEATTGGSDTTEPQALTIAETAVADGRFETLVAALTQA